MEIKKTGIIRKGLGGLYEVECNSVGTQTPLALQVISCKARGIFRHENKMPLVGDRVILTMDSEHENTAIIDEILPRKNALIRPPAANLDTLFVVIAAASPSPVLATIDKLISIAEFNKIEPVILVTKSYLNQEEADFFLTLYQKCGFTVFLTSAENQNGIPALLTYIMEHCGDKITAFAGASGVGKSTLLNTLFPQLSIATGALSRKIERGRHTTRHVELFPLSEIAANHNFTGYLADTPGFSMLDFTHFDFYTKEDLPYTFREFAPYLGKCRYKKCTHLREEECAVLEAVHAGIIPQERHDSFVAIYDSLKDKKEWMKHEK